MVKVYLYVGTFRVSLMVGWSMFRVEYGRSQRYHDQKKRKKKPPMPYRARSSIRRAVLFAFRAAIWLVIAIGIYRLGTEF